MSGALIDVRLQTRPIEIGRQLDRLDEPGLSAVVSSASRLVAEEGVQSVVIDHHPALARAEMLRIADEADGRWPLRTIILLHRHGPAEADALVQFVAVAADQPDHAQAACAWLASALRTRPPFWRKDLLADGTVRWHQPKAVQTQVQAAI